MRGLRRLRSTRNLRKPFQIFKSIRMRPLLQKQKGEPLMFYEELSDTLLRSSRFSKVKTVMLSSLSSEIRDLKKFPSLQDVVFDSTFRERLRRKDLSNKHE
jgi:hypothetical protein